MIEVINKDYKVGDTVIAMGSSCGFSVAQKIKEPLFKEIHSTVVQVNGKKATLKPFDEKTIYLEL